MSPPRARLNVFQKTQRLWDAAHPYNAAQAMELVGDFSQQAVAVAFDAAVTDLGLGEFVCERNEYWIESTQGAAHFSGPVGTPRGITNGPNEVGRASMVKSETPESTNPVEFLLAREMNRPFDPGRSFPFRPFDLTDNSRRYVGLVYQHWVADSVSIRMLMRQWLARLLGGGGCSPVKLPAGGMLGTFGPAVSGWSVVAQTASLLEYASRMKRMRRIDPKSDATIGVLMRDGPDGLAEAVRKRARTTGNTVGDVFLAAAAAACDAAGPSHRTGRRPDLAMGTIVDLRARGGGRAKGVFGLYLGFTMTTFAARELDDFDSLLRRTARERKTGLARKSAEASQLNMAIGYGIGLAKGPRKLREFYRKRFPLAGGLSSVNMTPGWAGEHHPSPLAAYHRVSPTGPMLPLVMTPTTLGKRLNLCCSYRTALMSYERTELLVQAFFDRLIRYVG